MNKHTYLCAVVGFLLAFPQNFISAEDDAHLFHLDLAGTASVILLSGRATDTVYLGTSGIPEFRMRFGDEFGLFGSFGWLGVNGLINDGDNKEGQKRTSDDITTQEVYAAGGVAIKIGEGSAGPITTGFTHFIAGIGYANLNINSKNQNRFDEGLFGYFGFSVNAISFHAF